MCPKCNTYRYRWACGCVNVATVKYYSVVRVIKSVILRIKELFK